MTALAAERRPPDPSVGLTFAGVVLLGGGNAVAVRIANQELAPLWDATLRFGLAAVVLMAAVVATRTPWPSGRALTGSVLYGIVGFALAFGCVHWALVRVPPGQVQTTLALVPLLTLLLAVAQGLETFRLAGLAGALIAFAGIAVVFGEQLAAATPAVPLVVVVLGAAFLAESNVIMKRYPKCHPIANNAVAMAVGSVALLGASLAAGEPRVAPADPQTWGAVAYVAIGGSVGVFTLFVHLVGRVTASAASHVMLLMPIVTIVAASVVTGDAITPPLVAGAVLVLGGVYVGAVGRPRRSPTPVATGSAVSQTAARTVLPETQPGCA